MALEELLKDIKRIGDTKKTLDDFVATFTKVVATFDDLKSANQAERVQRQQEFEDLTTQLRNDFAALKGSIETKIASVKDGYSPVKGVDYFDGMTPDITELARAAAELIKLPEYRAPIMDGPQEIRDKIDLLQPDELPLVLLAMQKEIEELKKRGGKGLSGTMAPSIGHWPLHERFTMDGVATTVTLSQGVGAQGTAIFGLRYQGQTQSLGTDYTVNGNKITFVSFTPEAGTIIDISYMP